MAVEGAAELATSMFYPVIGAEEAESPTLMSAEKLYLEINVVDSSYASSLAEAVPESQVITSARAVYDDSGSESTAASPKVFDLTEHENTSSSSDENHEFCSPESAQICDSSLKKSEDSLACSQRKYFYYGSPLDEETGMWIPVSVPPMPAAHHAEWQKGFISSCECFPEEESSWDQFAGENKEMTMWDVVSEMLLLARGKVTSLTSADLLYTRISCFSTHNLLEDAWKEMNDTLTEVSSVSNKEILETEPPKWLADSAAAACMLCSAQFHPIICSRHHCRFCGGIFCNDCSKGRSLLPSKFRTANPERVCDVCFVRLQSVQPYLMNEVSRASQQPTHDLTDLSTLRSWLNFPWGRTMEYEIYKAANIIRGYRKVGILKPEKSIPDSILKRAKGLAILTVVKVGVVVTYNIGTGLVVARRDDGSWSPPSAIATFGMGWGAQAGGELTDYIIVLRNKDAIKTFSGNAHLSIGAGLSAAAGITGRTAEADFRAGDGGYAACYTYSCSKGAFVGLEFKGNMVYTRALENSRFYGTSIEASDILLRSMPCPPAAAVLYRALSAMYPKA